MRDADDVEILVKDGDEKKGISSRTFFASIFFGIVLLSLLIYGFISALEYDKQVLDPELDAGDHENGSNSNTPDPKECHEIEFDYLLLAVRWPPSDCTEHQCLPHIPSRWIIHGLWPNYSNGSWPQFCCPHTPFVNESVSEIRSHLLKVWPNLLKGQSEESLWKHEWDKHGTCATKNALIRGELNYFNYTLSLFDEISMKRWLTSGEIKVGSKVKKSHLKSVISKAFGKQVTVHCLNEGIVSHSTTTESPANATEDGLLNNNNSLKPMNLESVHFCYDKENIKPVDCLDHDSCPEEFDFPFQNLVD